MLEYQNGVVLAIDYGLARIGIAQGDLSLKIAHPITTITTKNPNTQIQKIKKLILEWNPKILVIGFPLHMDGTCHHTTLLTNKFAMKLQKIFSLDIYLVDERLTSVVAKSILNNAKIHGEKQKNYIDQISAMEILNTFFINGYIKKI